MNIYCDNYSRCNGLIWDQGGDGRTRQVARAKGWHLFDGTDMGGRDHKATLCPHCVGPRTKLRTPPPLQPGQVELFEIVVTADE